MRIELGDITAHVTQKDIKNVHLSVYPPTGSVRISAPLRMKADTIRVFALSKLHWIKKQQANFKEQERETKREYLDRESHYLWGQRYLLEIIQKNKAPRVETSNNKLVLRARPGATTEKHQQILEAWYRNQLRDEALPVVGKWCERLQLELPRLIIQRMKTKWGSCTPSSRTIRLNLELVKKPPECMEYIVIHELIHFIEPTHNSRFIALMDKHIPKWRLYREELNRLPVRHEEWEY